MSLSMITRIVLCHRSLALLMTLTVSSLSDLHVGFPHYESCFLKQYHILYFLFSFWLLIRDVFTHRPRLKHPYWIPAAKWCLPKKCFDASYVISGPYSVQYCAISKYFLIMLWTRFIVMLQPTIWTTLWVSQINEWTANFVYCLSSIKSTMHMHLTIRQTTQRFTSWDNAVYAVYFVYCVILSCWQNWFEGHLVAANHLTSVTIYSLMKKCCCHCGYVMTHHWGISISVVWITRTPCLLFLMLLLVCRKDLISLIRIQ